MAVGRGESHLSERVAADKDGDGEVTHVCYMTSNF